MLQVPVQSLSGRAPGPGIDSNGAHSGPLVATSGQEAADDEGGADNTDGINPDAPPAPSRLTSLLLKLKLKLDPLSALIGFAESARLRVGPRPGPTVTLEAHPALIAE